MSGKNQHPTTQMPLRVSELSQNCFISTMYLLAESCSSGILHIGINLHSFSIYSLFISNNKNMRHSIESLTHLIALDDEQNHINNH